MSDRKSASATVVRISSAPPRAHESARRNLCAPHNTRRVPSIHILPQIMFDLRPYLPSYMVFRVRGPPPPLQSWYELRTRLNPTANSYIRVSLQYRYDLRSRSTVHVYIFTFSTVFFYTSSPRTPRKPYLLVPACMRTFAHHRFADALKSSRGLV